MYKIVYVCLCLRVCMYVCIYVCMYERLEPLNCHVSEEQNRRRKGKLKNRK